MSVQPKFVVKFSNDRSSETIKTFGNRFLKCNILGWEINNCCIFFIPIAAVFCCYGNLKMHLTFSRKNANGLLFLK